jgi:hypothetical protein
LLNFSKIRKEDEKLIKKGGVKLILIFKKIAKYD